MPGLIVLLLTAFALLVLITVGLVVATILDPPRRAAGYAIARGLPVDPADLNLPFEEWTLDLPDGAHLPVWEVRSADPVVAGSDVPTVVMIHAWGTSRVDSLSHCAKWFTHLPRIVMYDLRGHGESTPRRGPGRTRMGRGEHHDLIELLNRLRDGDAGVARVILVGASMGAAIALHAAAELEQRDTGLHIEHIIAVSPSPEPMDVLARRLRTMRLPGRPLAVLANGVLALLGRRPIGGRDLLAAARDVTCPVTIVHGADDQTVPAHTIAPLADATGNAEQIIVDAAGHLDQPLFDRAGHVLATRAATHAPPTRTSP